MHHFLESKNLDVERWWWWGGDVCLMELNHLYVGILQCGQVVNTFGGDSHLIFMG